MPQALKVNQPDQAIEPPWGKQPAHDDLAETESDTFGQRPSFDRRRPYTRFGNPVTRLSAVPPAADLDDALSSLTRAVEQSVGGPEEVVAESPAAQVAAEIEPTPDDPEVAAETIDDLGAYFCRLLDPDLAAMLLGDFRREIESCGPFGPQLFVYFCMGLEERCADRRLAADLPAADVIVALWEMWDTIAPAPYSEDLEPLAADIVVTAEYRFDDRLPSKASLAERLRTAIQSIWRKA